MTALWVAYATTAQEFNAQEQLEALGYRCDVPRKVELIRHAKRRRPDMVIKPFLPNYVFIHGGAEVFHATKLVKEIRSTVFGVGPHEARNVLAFIAKVELDYETRKAQIEAGQRVSEYNPGDLLTLMTGTFAGHLATFRRMVERADNPFPLIEAEVSVSMFGKPVLATVDPINARRVG